MRKIEYFPKEEKLCLSETCASDCVKGERYGFQTTIETRLSRRNTQREMQRVRGERQRETGRDRKR